MRTVGLRLTARWLGGCLGLVACVLGVLATYVIAWLHVAEAPHGPAVISLTLRQLANQFRPLRFGFSPGTDFSLWDASPLVMSAATTLIAIGSVTLLATRRRPLRSLAALVMALASGCVLYLTVAIGVPSWGSHEPLFFFHGGGWWLALAAALLGLAASAASTVFTLASTPVERVVRHPERKSHQSEVRPEKRRGCGQNESVGGLDRITGDEP